MKFRLLFLSFLTGLFTLSLAAATVTRDDAEKAARNFLFQTINKYGEGTSLNDIRFSGPYTHFSNGLPAFYAFHTNPGFVLVSAEDAFTPILGYSYEGTFDLEQAPAHYRGFIMNYVAQIDHIRAGQLPAEPEFKAAWDAVMGDPSALSVTRERDVEPLLYCTWDQGSPYNILCPADANGPGGHVWVGCVATAMAQIMYYWRYPETGTGQHCYTPGTLSYGQQCANFGQTSYQWEGMNNSIDGHNPFANAELQYHCAVSVNMNFSPNGSGSFSWLVPERLNSFFRYNNAQYREKQNYSTSGWISLLKADIDQGYPLYYSGYNPTDGGHAFVCDGYQGDNFHFNFGWSGSGNGYYSLSSVGGFNQGQACVRNFIPSDTDYPYHNTGAVTITNKSGSFTDGSGPIGNYLDNNTASWLIDPQTLYDSITSITLSFPVFDILPGDTVRIYDGGSTADVMLGAYSGTSLPGEVVSSSNQLLVTFTTNSSGSASGFYAEFTSTSPTWCSGLTQMTEPSGTFEDGSGDFYYQSGATCMWRIKPEDAGNIHLNFNYFDTEEGFDKVTVYDGQTKIAEFSGSEIPAQVTATSGSMFITWNTNQAGNFQGWEAYYEIDNVGLTENAGISRLSVYPNPSGGLMQVRFSLEEPDDLAIRLVSTTGQTIYSFEDKPGAGAVSHELDLRGLAPGMYFLELKTSLGTTSKKVVIR